MSNPWRDGTRLPNPRQPRPSGQEVEPNAPIPPIVQDARPETPPSRSEPGWSGLEIVRRLRRRRRRNELFGTSGAVGGTAPPNPNGPPPRRVSVSSLAPIVVRGDPTPVVDVMLEHLDVDREQLSLALFEIGINPHWPHALVRKVAADAAERGVLHIPNEIPEADDWPGRDEFLAQLEEHMRKPLT